MPPARSVVSTTSTAGFFVACISTGIPRPLSRYAQQPSSLMVTSMCGRRTPRAPRQYCYPPLRRRNDEIPERPCHRYTWPGACAPHQSPKTVMVAGHIWYAGGLLWLHPSAVPFVHNYTQPIRPCFDAVPRAANDIEKPHPKDQVRRASYVSPRLEAQHNTAKNIMFFIAVFDTLQHPIRRPVFRIPEVPFDKIDMMPAQ